MSGMALTTTGQAVQLCLKGSPLRGVNHSVAVYGGALSFSSHALCEGSVTLASPPSPPPSSAASAQPSPPTPQTIRTNTLQYTQRRCFTSLAANAPDLRGDSAAVSSSSSSSSSLNGLFSCLPHQAPPPCNSRTPLAKPNPQAHDPFALVRDEISNVGERMRRSIVTDVPMLGDAADYFFAQGASGKRVRPTVLLLLASVLSGSERPPNVADVDRAAPAAHLTAVDETADAPSYLRSRQQRLAEITELIHVASLLHDDVVDGADTRRGVASLNAHASNKLAVLAGDFLLARASVQLANLRDPDVIVLLSTVLEHLVAGEVMQLNADRTERLSYDHYMKKTYYKTASLLAHSCEAVAVLGGATAEERRSAHLYGKHLGIAFQLVDDALDFDVDNAELGKPGGGADMANGLVTLPVLYAMEGSDELRAMASNKFRGDGAVARALEIVLSGDAVERTRQLAAYHATMARDACMSLPCSRRVAQTGTHANRCRDALAELAARVVVRSS